MNRSQAKEFLEFATSRGLFSSVIFFVSPVTELVEKRHIYSGDEMEVIMWTNEQCQKYDNANIPYVAYINGKTENHNNAKAVMNALDK